MLDVRLIRAEPERVRAELAKVSYPSAELDALLEADRARREAITAVEQLRAERTKASNAIRGIKDPAEREAAIAANRAIGDRIAVAEAAAQTAEAEFDRRMLEVPNLPHPDVPVGPDDSANVVVRTDGPEPKFGFTPQPHWELGPQLGIIDFERGVKVAGTRFYLLRGAGARLQRALITWMLDLHTARARVPRGLSAGDGDGRRAWSARETCRSSATRCIATPRTPTSGSHPPPR